MTVAQLSSALADPARITILRALLPGELSVTELYTKLEFTQTKTSRHLSFLHEYKFVEWRREGRTVKYYRLTQDVKLFVSMIDKLVED